MAKIYSFHRFATEKELEEFDFPYANAGMTAYKSARFFFKASLVAEACNLLMNVLLQGAMSDYDGGSALLFPVGSGSVGDILSGGVSWVISLLTGGTDGLSADQSGTADISSMLINVLTAVGSFVRLVLMLSVFALAVSVVVYAVTWVMRSKSFERNMFRNDRESLRLKRELIRRLGYKKSIRDLNKKKWGSDGKSGGLSDKEQSELDMYNQLMNMDLRIYTRRSVAGPEVLDMARVQIQYPSSREDVDTLDSLLASFEYQASMASNNRFQFSSIRRRLDSSENYAWFEAVSLVEDKWAPKPEKKKEEKVEQSMYTFDLEHNLKDQRQAILDARTRAMTIGKQYGKIVDDILSTSSSGSGKGGSYGATHVGQPQVGSSSIRLDYRASFRDNGNDANTIAQKIQRILNLDSPVTVETRTNMTYITIPLPKEARTPIDVPNMYHVAFG